MSHLVVTAVAGLVGTVCDMSYTSDLADEQWALLEPVFNAPGMRGSKHAPDLRVPHKRKGQWPAPPIGDQMHYGASIGAATPVGKGACTGSDRNGCGPRELH